MFIILILTNSSILQFWARITVNLNSATVYKVEIDNRDRLGNFETHQNGKDWAAL